jgi:hypothetical protein
MLIDVNFKNNMWEVSFDGELLINLPLLMEQQAYQLQENIDRLFADMMWFELEEDEENDENMADK